MGTKGLGVGVGTGVGTGTTTGTGTGVGVVEGTVVDAERENLLMSI